MLYHNVRVMGTHLLVIDAVALVLFSYFGLWFFDAEAWLTQSPLHFSLLVFFLIEFFLFLGVGNRLNAYHAWRTERISKELLCLAEVALYAISISILLTQALGFGTWDPSLPYVVALAITCLVSLRLLMRLIIRRWRTKGKDDRIWLIVGSGHRADKLIQSISNNPHFGIRLHAVIDLPRYNSPDALTGDDAGSDTRRQARILQSVEEIRHILKQHVIDEVVITLPLRSYYDEIQKIIGIGRDAGISIMLPPDAFGTPGQKSELTMAGNVPMMTHFTGPSDFAQLGIKRLIDIIGSVIGLILLSPFFLVIAIAIKLDSPGKVLFLSKRAGLHGRTFRMVKFRSMVANAPELQQKYSALNETDGVAFKIKNDPRITRVGSILRSSHADEFTQLWNVLVGDMSLVGPRPLPENEATGKEWWHLRRLSMPPGMTCFWQISGDPTMPFEQWTNLDLKYIDNWSLWLDLKLISMTILVLFRRPGW